MTDPVVISMLPPCRMLNMNHRLHWAKKAELTRTWRTAGFAAALVAKIARGITYPFGPSTVSIALPVASLNVKRDPSNWYPTIKAIVDGLTDAGCWPDDNADWVATTEPTFHRSADLAHVVVTIKERQP